MPHMGKGLDKTASLSFASSVRTVLNHTVRNTRQPRGLSPTPTPGKNPGRCLVSCRGAAFGPKLSPLAAYKQRTTQFLAWWKPGESHHDPPQDSHIPHHLTQGGPAGVHLWLGQQVHRGTASTLHRSEGSGVAKGAVDNPTKAKGPPWTPMHTTCSQHTTA